MEYVNWIMTHTTELVAILGGAVTMASVIVKLTPTQKDDAALGVVMRLINTLALNPKK